MAIPISVHNLRKTYGATHALDDVSVEIAAGELFFLLGPSGCGKTTLLRSIAGFVTPDSGSILFGGEDISALPPHRRDTGMVFQSYALWPHMTLAQNVAFGLEMRGVGKDELKARVNEALALVKMADRAQQKPNQLSGGQQQRIALARALVVHPRCFLLDEPLSNLDAKLRLEMRTEIRRICKQAGLTSIYVTHDQKEALSVADRIAIMRDGRILQIGTPLEVYRRPRCAFVAGFIGEANLLDGVVRRSDAGRCEVETAAGAFTGVAAEPFDVGAKIGVCIRPESIRFEPAPAGVANVLAGQLSDTVYLGEVAQHQFHTRNGVEFKAFEFNPRRIARETAVEAAAWVDPEDVVVVRP